MYEQNIVGSHSSTLFKMVFVTQATVGSFFITYMLPFLAIANKANFIV